MKESEAVDRLAELLQAKAEKDMNAARELLGDRANVEAADVDYRLRAQEMLNAELTELAFRKACNRITGYTEQGYVAAPPPPPFQR